VLAVVSGMFGASFLLDGDAPSLTVDVPPDLYSVSLFNAAGYTTTWPLTRQNADGSVETVQATLDPLPQITVVENQTIPLALRFHVALAGPITFTHGSVHAFVEVDETAATSFQFVISSPSLSALTAEVTPDAPAALGPRLPTVGSTAHEALTAQTISPWFAEGTGAVCAHVSASVDASGDGEFGDLLAEAQSSDQAFVCIAQIAPQRTAIRFSTFRAGPATTPLLANLGASNYVVSYTLASEVPADTFDGTTLHLGAIAGSRATTVSVIATLSAFVPVGSGTRLQPWFHLFDDGDGTNTMTPL
jgi:hypothetical protein